MPAAMPNVSVCIPTRNRSGDLAERLAELSAQTYRDLEILVVDDGSTDDTPGVVANAQAADRRIRYVRLDPPVGVPEVVERCIAEAHANLVALFHDHDVYRSDAVERLLSVLTCSPHASFVFAGVRTIDSRTREVLDDSSEPNTPHLRTDVVKHFVKTGSSMVGASAVMVRRDQLPTPVFNRKMAFFADVDLWCRLALAGPVAYEPGPIADVVGWSEIEGLTKLNWSAIGALGRLRIEFARGLAMHPAANALTIAWIQADTARKRVMWTARVVRHATRSDDALSSALATAPGVVRTAAELTRRGRSLMRVMTR